MGLKALSRRRHLPEMNLNITSLLDVLTVLLFFLIKSFSVSSSSLSQPKDLRLPAGATEDQIEESVTVMLSQNQLYFNDRPLLVLQNQSFQKSDLGQDQRTLVKLKALLDKEYQKKMAVFKGTGDTSFLPPGKIIIQSDKDLKFATVKHLLHTVAASGYTDYQLVVKKPEN